MIILVAATLLITLRAQEPGPTTGYCVAFEPMTNSAHVTEIFEVPSPVWSTDAANSEYLREIWQTWANRTLQPRAPIERYNAQCRFSLYPDQLARSRNSLLAPDAVYRGVRSDWLPTAAQIAGAPMRGPPSARGSAGQPSSSPAPVQPAPSSPPGGRVEDQRIPSNSTDDPAEQIGVELRRYQEQTAARYRRCMSGRRWTCELPGGRGGKVIPA